MTYTGAGGKSDYQKVLTELRSWVKAQTSGFDIWAPRWQMADQVSGSMASGSNMADLYAGQVLRAVNQLVEEGVLVKLNSGRDARYMSPEIREREVKAAEEAGRQHAAKVARYRSARDRLAKAGFADIGNSQLDIRLSLEEWEQLIDIYLNDDGGS